MLPPHLNVKSTYARRQHYARQYNTCKNHVVSCGWRRCALFMLSVAVSVRFANAWQCVKVDNSYQAVAPKVFPLPGLRIQLNMHYMRLEHLTSNRKPGEHPNYCTLSLRASRVRAVHVRPSLQNTISYQRVTSQTWRAVGSDCDAHTSVPPCT